MRSPSNYSFAVAPSVQMPRSAFKTDRTYKTAFDSGYLIPCFFDEVYPGDTFNVGLTAFGRLSTPVVPFMDNLHMDFQFFYVPYRLLWQHWVNMNGEQSNPDDSTDYLTPIVSNESGFAVGSLFDYFGYPVGVAGVTPNVWLCRAYNKIWNDHYRDENLQDSVPENTGDGPDNSADYVLLRRGKRKDYFTSCLPWPQKGPGAEIPLGGTAPIIGNPNQDDLVPVGIKNTGSSDISPSSLSVRLNSSVPAGAFVDYHGNNIPGLLMHNGTQQVPGILAIDADKVAPGLLADLSSATAITINSLRQAVQIQRLWEKDARGGTRYGEMVYQHFGVRNPDSRLQRSEYLGGGSIPIQIHSVAQTSATDSVTPQGNLAAYGVAGGRVGFSKSFVEHGVVIGLVSVRADLNYQQGLDRAWSRRTRFDYYWPSLAHLGEQAVLNKEIFAQGTSADDEAFGYQERWAELRYGHSHITGKLRSRVTGSLDVWHLAQAFSSLPQLNSSFIEDNPPLSRVLAVQDEPQIIFDSLATVSCVRCLPMYSIPGLMDHF